MWSHDQLSVNEKICLYFCLGQMILVGIESTYKNKLISVDFQAYKSQK